MAAKQKTLPVTCEQKSYTNPDTGKTTEYNQYCLIVNGLPLVIKVSDNTARLILNKYFEA